ncbi:LolA family protein [Polyangium spumosum]|uniref:Outer membrane lipoprotein carrier protein LolA n=1 Tax=Polyangium spumosum TaxID=889282 RepID=A0A6N7PVH4_9BACT|nr:outer membrane lipoprotein carrier protein LolA [Polyangium spumosum]MRG94255.1 outer membrane lipoprotein carrier protein LolA [Polyangium spumosum]
MDRRDFFRNALAASGALLLPSTLASEAYADEVSEVLAQITKARADLKTLVGPFEQERTIGLLATAVKSAGEMSLVRPDRLRWELLPPDAVTYWVGPEGFSFATPRGAASVGKAAAGRFAAVLGDLLILMGGDLQQLRARYELTVPSKKDGITLRAVPRAEDVKKHVKRLEMRLGLELWTIKEVTIEEQSGDLSVIRFGKLKRDVAVDPAKMKPSKR